jgi:hypothetical protein
VQVIMKNKKNSLHNIKEEKLNQEKELPKE